MRFIAMYSLKENTDQAKVIDAINRRAEYEHPVTLIEEFYTPNRSPTVIAVYETDDVNKLLMNSMAWVDLFDIEVIPVVQWREGLEALKP
jgi:hypothetical protein